MALLVDNTLRKHLKILTTINSQSNEVLVDFCKLALDFMKNGPNVKKYNIAAQKLEIDVEIVENSITALVKLLIDAGKYSISKEKFGETLIQIGFDKDQREVLEKFYVAKQETIRDALGQLGSSLPSYHDLQWRIEAQVASRNIPCNLQTNAVLNLQLDTTANYLNRETSSPDKNVKNIPLQCDLPNLVHMTAQLETALRESKTFHIRRMQRLLDQ